ncbi:MAG: hypothetical protein JSV25_09750 [Spirochaetota bacterium]|nr:MAG: hypothetical protein JSV25_09750 [Spirochaetota bacterium]
MNETNVLQSMHFIPINSKKIPSRIEVPKPDAFILDLEDRVPEGDKESSKDNTAVIMEGVKPIDE